VFVTALEQLARFRGEGSFAGWLFQIARNAVRDSLRVRPGEELAERPALGPTPEELLLEGEQTEELRRLIRQLRPEQQHLLALRYGAELPYEEIGAMLGAAPATVRVRMHRILEELRRRYPHDNE
jgi:RNA polymerase sigma-70 factor (ECF subfamily)